MTSVRLSFLIFTTFFKIALFVVGGGLAMIPVLQEIFVKKHKLLTEEDILDMVTMTQTVPGLIAVNASLFIGNRLMGLKGSIIAVTGLLIPSLVIIITIAALFSLLAVKNPHWIQTFSCVRACVAGIFITTALFIGKKVLKNKFDVLITLCFIVALFFISPAWLILAAIPVGWVYAFFEKKTAKKTGE